MCGIAGALTFGRDGFTVTTDYLDAMRDTMVHRGPDGCGTWVRADGRVGLAHRRLSIIDLSDLAAQPMSNADGSLQVSFNGEIYNHAEIRAELMRLGHQVWKTDHSDTEVILHSFAEWGIDCVHRFRGMFAIAIWDERARALWLIRDRIGVKPLYYSVHHGRITFASEIKALLTDPDQPREVHREAFFHYLSFLTTPSPQTLFDGIKKVANGCWLRIDLDGRMEERRYWDAFDGVVPLIGVSDQEISERVLAGLRKAVALRKVADVPVGVFLSGGIDSSTNTMLLSEGESSPVHTFSIGYDRDYSSYTNELRFARLVAERAGSVHHERLIDSDDLVEFVPRMVQLQDEPIADPVCVPLYFLADLARSSGMRVCQVGEGADELFRGYPSWKTMGMLQQLDDLPASRPFEAIALRALAAAGRAGSLPFEWLRRGVSGVPVFWSGAEAFTEEQKRQLLSPTLRREFAGHTSWEALAPLHRRYLDRAWDRSALHWMTYSDLNLRLPELLLMRVDKMTMGVGLEARVPFLDHEFVQLALSIPTRVKTRGGVLKTVLKRAVRGLIPDEIIDRPKQGFGVPVQAWFTGGLGEWARNELRSFCRQTDFLDVAAVDALLAGTNGASLWYLLNFALWWRTHVERRA